MIINIYGPWDQPVLTRSHECTYFFTKNSSVHWSQYKISASVFGYRPSFLRHFDNCVTMFRAVFIVSLCISVVFSLGGEQKIVGDDEEVQNAIKFAMSELNAMSNNYYRYMAFETLDATKQVGKYIFCFYGTNFVLSVSNESTLLRFERKMRLFSWSRKCS